jgi:ketosteroid isomerase-like protein
MSRPSRVHLVLVFAIATIFSACAPSGERAASSPAPSATASVSAGINAEQEVRGIAEETFKAFVQQDAAALERLLPDDFTHTNPRGEVRTKSDAIALAKSGDYKIEVGKTEDVKVRMFDNAALVTGRRIEKSTYKGKKNDVATQFTSVYVKRNGKWQCVSSQLTLIPPQNPKS